MKLPQNGFGKTTPWSYADIDKLLSSTNTVVQEVGEIAEELYIRTVKETLETQ